jgi:uncharacterized phage protein gp47/JayE
MFQIKNFNSIVAAMINNVSGGSANLTDFNTGSVVRTLLEAVAAEIDQQYQSMLKGFYEAVPVAIYKSFSFGKVSAVGASGYVTFTRSPAIAGDVLIPAGTRVAVPGSDFTYAVEDNVTMAAGTNTVDAFVVAGVTGDKTNCLAGTIVEIVDAVEGLLTVTNAAGFSNGQDEETIAERKMRFQKWLSTLARSTRSSIYYGALTAQLKNEAGTVTERVTKAVVHEPCIDDDPPGDPGYIELYIWNGVGGASVELIQETNKILYGYTDASGVKVPGWKGAGIAVNVYPVTAELIDVTATITLDGTRLQAEVDADIKAAIDSFFSGLEIAETFIWAKFFQAVIGVRGVADVSFSAPLSNMDVATWSHIFSQGTVTLTYA